MLVSSENLESEEEELNNSIKEVNIKGKLLFHKCC